MNLDIIYNIGSPILGGAIGYFTNWLAIKMLFLPHNPKYIAGHKLPFTPGLIPKEKERIAQKIALVVEDKILNKETLKESILTKENEEKIYLFLEQIFLDFKEKDFTIEQILEKIYKNDKDKKIRKTQAYILLNIKKIIYNKENQDYICGMLLDNIFHNIYAKNNGKYIKDALKKISLELLKEENAQKIKNKKISDFINQENLSEIKISIFENIPKACDYICNILETNKELDEKMHQFVKNIAQENLGALGGLFLNVDKIYMSIKQNIIAYLRDSEKQNIIGLKVFETISLYQNKTFDEIYQKVPENTKQMIENKLDKDNIEKHLQKLIESKTFEDILEKNMLKLKEKSNQLLENSLKMALANKLYKYIKAYVINNTDKVLKMRLNYILDNIDIKAYKNDITNGIEKIMLKQGDKFLSNIAIGDIVENKINSFDMQTIEQIILSVAKKELNAITIIGGVLGFVIGLIPVILR